MPVFVSSYKIISLRKTHVIRILLVLELLPVSPIVVLEIRVILAIKSLHDGILFYQIMTFLRITVI